MIKRNLMATACGVVMMSGVAHAQECLTEPGTIGFLPKLEDQLLTWEPGESRSPDRLDALVHAVRTLIPEPANLIPTRYRSPVHRSI